MAAMAQPSRALLSALLLALLGGCKDDEQVVPAGAAAATPQHAVVADAGGPVLDGKLVKASILSDPLVVEALKDASAQNMFSLFELMKDYARDHNGALPDTLEQLRVQARSSGRGSGEGADDDFDQTMTNPLTGQRPGYLYVKPAAAKLEDVHEPARTPLMFELKRDRTPDKDGSVLWADGRLNTEPRASLPVAPTRP